ncbi:hypothetical protein ElyMa_004222500 [Elysia marginata]|uniref:Uncharacterized protein n=1 Tax=Elysia marginata TaxID=1093978 RepID=A0AAV4GR92_9GAST|nr:hypothetical protein ElyMa_004222500 [Elysia marginata]
MAGACEAPGVVCCRFVINLGYCDSVEILFSTKRAWEEPLTYKSHRAIAVDNVQKRFIIISIRRAALRLRSGENESSVASNVVAKRKRTMEGTYNNEEEPEVIPMTRQQNYRIQVSL